jgi:hypothetical protein
MTQNRYKVTVDASGKFYLVETYGLNEAQVRKLAAILSDYPNVQYQNHRSELQELELFYQELTT